MKCCLGNTRQLMKTHIPRMDTDQVWGNWVWKPTGERRKVIRLTPVDYLFRKALESSNGNTKG
jgi:hypothetical protein